MATLRGRQKGYRPLGNDQYRNVLKGSPRKGKTFTMGPKGAHVYGKGPKRVVIGKPPSMGPKGNRAAAQAARQAAGRPARGTPNRAPNRGRQPGRQQPGRGPAGPQVDPYAAQVSAATQLEFAPLDAQLASERRISDQRAVNVPSWFQNYQAQLQGLAASVDAEKDPGYKTYMESRLRNAAGQQGQAMENEARRRRGIEESGREVAVKKGAFGTKYRGELEAEAYKRKLEAAAFGLEQTQAELAEARKTLERGDDRSDERFDRGASRADDRRLAAGERRQARKDRTDLSDKDRKFELDVQKFGLSVAKEKRMAREGREGGGRNPLTRGQRQDNRDQFDKGVTAVQALTDAKKWPSDPKAAAKKARQIAAGEDIPLPIMRAAVQRVRLGGVRKPLRRRVKRQFEIKMPSRPPLTKQRLKDLF